MPAKTDPQKAAKQWAIAQAVIEAGPTATVLYADESRIHVAAPGPRHVALGRPSRSACQRLAATGRVVCSGARTSATGQWTYLVREHMHKEDFIVFLEHLLTVYAVYANGRSS